MQGAIPFLSFFFFSDSCCQFARRQLVWERIGRSSYFGQVVLYTQGKILDMIAL